MYRPKRTSLRKDSVIGVRVSDDEMARIKDSAREAGLTLSSWSREIIIDYLRMVDSQSQEKAES